MHRSLVLPFALSLAAALALAAPRAHAQGFNIDIGSNLVFGLPSSTYGAAATQAGVWNAVDATSAGGTALIGLGGTPTGASITNTGGAGNLDFDNPGTTGDDQALLDDAQDVGPLGSVTTWTIQGLAVDTYDVYVYAFSPNNPTTTLADVAITTTLPCIQSSGLVDWPGTHVAGVSYVQNRVRVAGGNIFITVASNTGRAAVNGIQIVRVGFVSGFGAMVRAPCSFQTVTGNPNILGWEKAFGFWWVTASVPGGAVIYQFDTNCNLISTTTACAAGSDLSADEPGGSLFTVTGSQACVYTFSSVPPPYGTLTCTQVVPSVGSLRGMARRSFDGHFFTSNVATGTIIEFTITAGTFVPVNTFPATGKSWYGFGFDDLSNTLWGFSRDDACGSTTNLAEFNAIDPATGQLTGLSFPGACVDTTNEAGGCDVDTDQDNLGRLSLLGLHQSSLDTPVVYDLGATASLTYCTAKVNSLGCLTRIGSSGLASASSSAGFTITGSNVRNNKSGLLFYGINGQAGAPFHGGFRCVNTPVRRTPVVSSGGALPPTNNCSGLYHLDMNAFATGALGGTPLAALLVPGTVVDCQWWGRDPGFLPPDNVTLTNGLEYVVGP